MAAAASDPAPTIDSDAESPYPYRRSPLRGDARLPATAPKVTFDVRWSVRPRPQVKDIPGGKANAGTMMADLHVTVFFFRANGEFKDSLSLDFTSVGGNDTFTYSEQEKLKIQKIMESRPASDAFHYEVTLPGQAFEDIATAFIVVGPRESLYAPIIERLTCEISDHSGGQYYIKMKASEIGDSTTVILASVRWTQPGSAGTAILTGICQGAPHATIGSMVARAGAIMKERFVGEMGEWKLPALQTRAPDAVLLGAEEFAVALSWDYSEACPEADLDLACLLVKRSGAVFDVAAFGSRVDGARHGGDARTGRKEGKGGLEVVTITRAHLPEYTRALVFVVTSNQPIPRLNNAYLRLASGSSAQSEAVLAYDLSDCTFFGATEAGHKGVIAFALTCSGEDQHMTHYDVWNLSAEFVGNDFCGALSPTKAMFSGPDGKAPTGPLACFSNPAPSIPGINLLTSMPEGTTLYHYEPGRLQQPSTARAEVGKPLSIHVHLGHDLMSADSNGLSDPYVVIRHMDGDKVKQKVQTTVQRATLFPVWTETFTLDGPLKGSDIIHFEIFDKDMIGKDYLGEFEIKVTNINYWGPRAFVAVDKKHSCMNLGFVVMSLAWDERFLLTKPPVA